MLTISSLANYFFMRAKTSQVIFMISTSEMQLKAFIKYLQ